MNCETLALSVGVGLVGYEAVREWRRVQEDLPSCSTSGGQSDGGTAANEEAVVGWVVEAVADFAAWRIAAKELHDRHGLPSFPRIMPFGYFFGRPSAGGVAGGVSGALMVTESLESSAIVAAQIQS